MMVDKLCFTFLIPKGIVNSFPEVFGTYLQIVQTVFKNFYLRGFANKSVYKRAIRDKISEKKITGKDYIKSCISVVFRERLNHEVRCLKTIKHCKQKTRSAGRYLRGSSS